jgi:hypothetical protein
MISYNLAPIPIWPLVDNLGDPLANGFMLTFRDLVRSEFKPVYQDPAGLIPYIQPIVFNAAGFQGPFYWASDENYSLEIYDSNANLVKTVSAYNAPSAGGSGPITINANNRNYISDSQFRYGLVTDSFIPAPMYAQIGTSNWFFAKNNTTATDSISFHSPIIGSTNPPNNPPYYLNYTCSVAGNSEVYKNVYWRFQSVYSFQNTEITVAFWAISQTPGVQVKLLCHQFFGVGGSPDNTIYPATFSLTTSWAQYSITFTVPSVSGTTIIDAMDFLGIGIQLPLDQICNINVTNFQLNNGNTLQPFDYLPATNAATLQVPFFDTGDSAYTQTSLYIDSNNRLSWQNIVPIGSVLIWVGPPGSPLPSNWVACDGLLLQVSEYSELYSLIGVTFGGTVGVNFNLPDLRGMFTRGYDYGRGVDPGRTWGSVQGSQNLSHVHPPGAGIDYIFRDPSSAIALAGGTDVGFDFVATTGAEGGSESRPINIAFFYIIKVL